jgi:hypothetical protein
VRRVRALILEEMAMMAGTDEEEFAMLGVFALACCWFCLTFNG